jgi:tetratricopeptide (TPR) repeat protein
MTNKNLSTSVAGDVADQTFSRSQRAKLYCQLARQLERAGEYETACEALKEFWPDRVGPVALDDLDPETSAELLLRAGMLTGWVGSASQAGGAQERAKNLISRSVELFEQLGETSRVAAARSDLALCYWREGAFDEARLILRDAMDRMGEDDREARAVALIRLGMLEKAAGRYSDSLRIHHETAPSIESIESHAIKGTFHNEFAGLLTRLGIAEGSEAKIDQALVEYAAASFHFEQAGHLRFRACVENNLAYLLIRIGRLGEAHSHLDAARSLCLERGDVRLVAQFDDTRARALLEEGRLSEAEAFAQQAVAALEKGGEQSLLAETLTTLGVVLARRGKHLGSRATLERAIEVARISGDPEGAGRAALSILEELGPYTSAAELAAIYQSAADLLERSQDPLSARRLMKCARHVIDAIRTSGAEKPAMDQNWEGFSLRQELLCSEKMIIKRALEASAGVVSKAALLLGFSHHQSLINLINTRHPDLLKSRSPVRIRRRSIMRKP